jgi:hypothetical protein
MMKQNQNENQNFDSVIWQSQEQRMPLDRLIRHNNAPASQHKNAKRLVDPFQI